jgi:hypothetical protein
MKKIAPEEQFWNWFVKNSNRLFYFEKYEDALLYETITQLQKIHTDLVFEIGPEIDGQREFIISANGIKEAFSSVIELVKSAPSFDNWNIITFRQRKKDIDMKIQIDDVTLSPEDIYFDHISSQNKVDLNLFIKDMEEDDERIYHIIFIILDNIVGEYDVEMKLGKIDIFPFSKAKNPEKLLPVKRLPTIIDELSRNKVD